MGPASPHRPARPAAGQVAGQVADKIRAALALVAEAYDYARDTGRDVWEFAVEIDVLQAVGLTPNDFRWLVQKGYLEHAHETTKSGAGRRKFRRCRGQTLYKRSCFILTDAGLALARTVADAPRASAALAGCHTAQNEPGHGSPPHPHWNAELRELSVDGQVIKRYKSPAPNQERVLLAFEEEDWPLRIDDPLPPRPESDSKRRLHDTIKSLNHHHRNWLIHFLGDGTGEGVCWELLQAHSSANSK